MVPRRRSRYIKKEIAEAGRNLWKKTNEWRVPLNGVPVNGCMDGKIIIRRVCKFSLVRINQI